MVHKKFIKPPDVVNMPPVKLIMTPDIVIITPERVMMIPFMCPIQAWGAHGRCEKIIKRVFFFDRDC